jgi:FtsZ-binding cell division protein ZapB
MDLIEQQEELGSLESLESRIFRAVETVAKLREEKVQLAAQLEASRAEQQNLQRELEQTRARQDSLTHELESLRAEKKQVRSRIEKLLGQIDLISTEQ